MIMGVDSFKTVRGARRIHIEERWDAKALHWVKVVPRNLGATDKCADGTIPEVVTRGPARGFTKEELESLKTKPTRKHPSLQIKQEIHAWMSRMLNEGEGIADAVA